MTPLTWMKNCLTAFVYNVCAYLFNGLMVPSRGKIWELHQLIRVSCQSKTAHLMHLKI